MRVADLDVGIDVGPTRTAAVAVNRHGRVLIKAIVASTGSLEHDVAAAIEGLCAEDVVARDAIGCVMVSTPAAHEAVHERRGLRRTATIRIGAPLTHAIPPLFTWPADLRAAVSAGEVVVAGGAESDGRTAPLDTDAIAAFLATVAERADAVAIAGVFAAVDPEPELAAADVVVRELGAAVPVSLSHEVGPIGLLERENATTLNAALTAAAEGVARDLRAALESARVDAELFVARNDGTLMALDHAVGLPVMTIRTGAATAMRGAFALSGVGDAIVVEAGDTRTRVGALVNCLPRESAQPAELAGVRTSCRVPDVIELDTDGDSAGALVAAVQRIEASLEPSPVVAVGPAGGQVAEAVAGTGRVVCPPDGDVAGAVGAATATVSGQAELICANRADQRAACLANARSAARADAMRAGADPDTTDVVGIDEIPLTYLVEPAVRIRVKAAGPPSRIS